MVESEAAALAGAIVETTNGPIQGYRADRLHVFKGVRYGAPPVGALRFKPPTRPQAWTDVASALTLGAPAVQHGSTPGQDAGGASSADPAAPDQPVSSEDCLFLNVWTQGLTGKRPVMVWLHGGHFASGSGGAAMYDGGNLARRGDVVTVTLNHRLNVFGYLHLGDIFGEEFASSGTAGMLDIVLALEWVRDNIAAFGGDPDNVTIYGESGGGGKVTCLHAMPAAHGLFHKAIVQSGPFATAVPRKRATKTAQLLLDYLNVKDAETLQALDGAEIAKAAVLAPKDTPAGEDALIASFPYAPCINGAALTRHPFVPDAPEMSKGVPLMIGSNKDESTLYMMTTEAFKTASDENLLELLRSLAGDKAEAVIGPLREAFPDYTPGYLYLALHTAMGVWFNSIQLAERKLAQNAGKVWMYLLTWETPIARGSMKSPHALDLPLVMDNVETSRGFVGRGDDPQRVADQMADAWIAFARNGDPSTPKLACPAYDAQTRATLIFNVESAVVNDPYADVRKVLAS